MTDLITSKLEALLKLTQELRDQQLAMGAQLKTVTEDVVCLKRDIALLQGAGAHAAAGGEPTAKQARTESTSVKSEKPKYIAPPAAAGGAMVLHVMPNYSDKAMVVYGKEACMALKDRLFKPHNFSFNKNLRCGAGWLIPRSKMTVERLRELLKADQDGDKITVVVEGATPAAAPAAAAGDNKRKTSDAGDSDE